MGLANSTVVATELNQASPPKPKRNIWWDFHIRNPGVYRLFEFYARQMIDAGVTKSSGWLICNRIRWEVVLKTVGSEYKISNDFIQYYTRLFTRNHPQHYKVLELPNGKQKVVSFFMFKSLKNEDDEWWKPNYTGPSARFLDRHFGPQHSDIEGYRVNPREHRTNTSSSAPCSPGDNGAPNTHNEE